ncbi:MAG: hypothetical protein JO267_05465 [Alphaproteobacteria bacterium]|nr:hypothetical protein [Alphaproteobacteria bacterium]
MSARAAILLVSAVAAAVAASSGHAAKAKKSAEPATSSKSAPGPSQLLGSAESWSAYKFEEKGSRVCYIVGQPQKSEPAAAKRRPPSAMVTHRPDQKILNVVSFVEGYPLKSGSDVSLDIGGSKYTLFTKDDSAWASTSELDKTIVEALGRGKQAVVTGISERGKSTVDTYSLSGFSKALALIDDACGVKH